MQSVVMMENIFTAVFVHFGVLNQQRYRGANKSEYSGVVAAGSAFLILKKKKWWLADIIIQ